MLLDGKEYDFVDFGASKGGSIDFAKFYLGGKNGLGIDISTEKIEAMIASGYDCIHGDITNLENIPDDSVRFVVLSHVLEHLYNIEDISKSIKEALRIATDFVFIQGPYFDGDEYLKQHGLKFYWSDWHGHTYHLTTQDLDNILEDTQTVHRYKSFYREEVKDSSSPYIHPIDSPIDQHDYDSQKHPPKDTIHFTQKMYKEIICIVAKRDFNYWDRLLYARGNLIDAKTGQRFRSSFMSHYGQIIRNMFLNGGLGKYLKRIIKGS